MVEEEPSDIKVLTGEARKQLVETARELRIRVAESKSQAQQLCAL